MENLPNHFVQSVSANCITCIINSKEHSILLKATNVQCTKKQQQLQYNRNSQHVHCPCVNCQSANIGISLNETLVWYGIVEYNIPLDTV